eukprot:g12268.t1
MSTTPQEEANIRRQHQLLRSVTDSVSKVHDAYETVAKAQITLLRACEELLFEGCCAGSAGDVAELGAWVVHCSEKLLQHSKAAPDEGQTRLQSLRQKLHGTMNELEETLYLFEQRDVARGQWEHYDRKLLELRNVYQSSSGNSSLATGLTGGVSAAKLQRNEKKLADAKTDLLELQEMCGGAAGNWAKVLDSLDSWLFVGLKEGLVLGDGFHSSPGGGLETAAGGTVAGEKPKAAGAGWSDDASCAVGAGRTSSASSNTFSPSKRVDVSPPSGRKSVPSSTSKQSHVIEERNSAVASNTIGEYPNNLPASASTSSSPPKTASSYPSHIGARVEVVGRAPERVTSPSSRSPLGSPAGAPAADSAIGAKRDVDTKEPDVSPTRQKQAQVVTSQPKSPETTAAARPPSSFVDFFTNTPAPAIAVESIVPGVLKDDDEFEQELRITLTQPLLTPIARVFVGDREMEILPEQVDEGDCSSRKGDYYGEQTNLYNYTQQRQSVSVRGVLPKHTAFDSKVQKSLLPVRIEAVGLSHFCFQSGLSADSPHPIVDRYTHLRWDANCGLNITFDDSREVAERSKGSMDAVVFSKKCVDYYEVEILELTTTGSQMRTASFGFLWALPEPGVKLARIGKNAQEMRNTIIAGGELPQIFVDGKSVKRNLAWRPRRSLKEGDRIGVGWVLTSSGNPTTPVGAGVSGGEDKKPAEGVVSVWCNDELVVEKKVGWTAAVGSGSYCSLHPLVDVAGNVRKVGFIQGAQKPQPVVEEEDEKESDSE